MKKIADDITIGSDFKIPSATAIKRNLRGVRSASLEVMLRSRAPSITGLLYELRRKVPGGDGSINLGSHYDKEWTRKRLLHVLASAEALLPGGWIDRAKLRAAIDDEMKRPARVRSARNEKISADVERLALDGVTPKDIAARIGISYTKARDTVNTLKVAPRKLGNANVAQ